MAAMPELKFQAKYSLEYGPASMSTMKFASDTLVGLSSRE